MKMIAVRKKKKINVYSVYCFAVVLVGCICRAVRRVMNGKCGKLEQAIFSVLAFLSLGGTVLFCAAVESDALSWTAAIIGAGACLLSFTLFAGLAGAFRPYRYMKEKQKFVRRGHSISAPAEAVSQMKKSA